jgi:hypothetical protein
MKKLTILSCVLAVSLLACQKEQRNEQGNLENNQSSARAVDDVLPRKIRSVRNEGGRTITDFDYRLTYDGKKIKSITDPSRNSRQDFFYEGDLIKKDVTTQKEDGEDYSSTVDYFYDNQKRLIKSVTLTKVVEKDGEEYSTKTTELISYNGNIVTEEEIFEVDGEKPTRDTFVTILKDGNRVKTYSIVNGKTASVSTKSYDNKNNPFRNITGLKVVYLPVSGLINKNNLRTSKGKSLVNADFFNSSTSYQYNTLNYPVTERCTISLRENDSPRSFVQTTTYVY